MTPFSEVITRTDLSRPAKNFDQRKFSNFPSFCPPEMSKLQGRISEPAVLRRQTSKAGCCSGRAARRSAPSAGYAQQWVLKSVIDDGFVWRGVACDSRSAGGDARALEFGHFAGQLQDMAFRTLLLQMREK